MATDKVEKKILVTMGATLLESFDGIVDEMGSTRNEQIRSAMRFYMTHKDSVQVVEDKE